MRRTPLLIFWLSIPVLTCAYHFGPGMERLALDEVADLIADAERHVTRAEATMVGKGDLADPAARQDWTEAEALYADALTRLPSDKVLEQRQIRLERNKARMHISQLPEANADLEGLIEEMSADESCDRALLSDVRNAFASSQYYMTWLKRLEGAPREEWEPEIDAARQCYKLLSEEAQAEGNAKKKKEHQENLEAAIRLARLDLTELQGLPIPNQ